jgi:hypothetical protein
MDGWYELARHKAEEDAGREIVFPYAVPEFEVGLEHVAQRKGYRLACGKHSPAAGTSITVVLTLRRT